MEIKQGLIFSGKHFTGRVEVLAVNKADNSILVNLTMPSTGDLFYTDWVEKWNLQHTVWGFKRKDYFEKEFPKEYPKPLKNREQEIHSFFHEDHRVMLVKARSAMEA